ncbi:hypothetical protein V6N12_012617 [Hibiscus sabdariffa]|uniref:Putative plant transposon protein domain-containing protein n=1 Tax=Hibiscus sabdariffa TaxID=183260 RepID=A0ABR2DD85_9ROSI
MIRGVYVQFDEGYINSLFDLVCVEDKHEKFINSMSTTKLNKILVDLYKSGMTWIISPEGSRFIKRVALKYQARAWNHFLKASLMPITHNETMSEERMEMLHSIIMGRHINVGWIIIEETFKCI